MLDQSIGYVIGETAGTCPDLSTHRHDASHLFIQDAVVQGSKNEATRAGIAIQGGRRANRDKVFGCVRKKSTVASLRPSSAAPANCL